MQADFCLIDNCESLSLHLGLCGAHYCRWLRYGNPLGGGPMRPRGTPEQRFWLKVDKDGPIPAHRPELGPCWVWRGYPNKQGYGVIWGGLKAEKAHRFAYELLVGPIPADLRLDHICHNGSGCPGGDSCAHRACVNPTHLEAVTQRENCLRGEGPTAIHARKTHCVHGHPFDEANTLIQASGQRKCRLCSRERHRRRARLMRERRIPPSIASEVFGESAVEQ